MTNIPRVCRIIGSSPWIFFAIAGRATAVLARAGIRRAMVRRPTCLYELGFLPLEVVPFAGQRMAIFYEKNSCLRYYFVL